MVLVVGVPDHTPHFERGPDMDCIDAVYICVLPYTWKYAREYIHKYIHEHTQDYTRDLKRAGGFSL
jgi:hypothetical protein